MANRSLFASFLGRWTAGTDARNTSGATAYARPPRQALAQYAVTGCLNGTFYATAHTQLDRLLALCQDVPADFLAKTAVYARERGQMKDAPALLLAALSRRDPALMDRVFDRVIDNPRMLRTFVQIVRSGATGRKSLGSAPKRCVRRWLERRSDTAVFSAAIGSSPSLADIVRLVHPKPASPSRAALYGHLVGKPVEARDLPEIVREFEAFAAGQSDAVPDVPFQKLAGLTLRPGVWSAIARRASWQTMRMNLNTFARHGVFEDAATTATVAARLRDAGEIARARVLPFQLLAAVRAVTDAVPAVVRGALEAAMEQAIANVPAMPRRVVVCPDVSGSMQQAVTGDCGSATTTVRCVDVAGLMAAAFLRRVAAPLVLPFDTEVRPLELRAADPVTTNVARLASVGGGGTAVSAPIAWLNARAATADLVIIVSDNESWADTIDSRQSATLVEWAQFRRRNPKARLVLVDLQPSLTTQATDREDVLNVGGFSDEVFALIAAFAAGQLGDDHFTSAIERMAL